MRYNKIISPRRRQLRSVELKHDGRCVTGEITQVEIHCKHISYIISNLFFNLLIVIVLPCCPVFVPQMFGGEFPLGLDTEKTSVLQTEAVPAEMAAAL